MAVQRSPPNSASKLNPQNPPIHYNSDSALDISSKTDSEDNYHNNITKRFKRTFGDYTEQSESSISELKSMIVEFKVQQDHKFDLLSGTLNTIATQNQEIKNSIGTLTSQHQELLEKIVSLEKENCEHKNRVTSLENQIDLLEKNARSTTIEIRNLPKQEIENKKVFSNLVQNLGSALGLETPIEGSEIRDIYRSKSEAVVVEFTTTMRKESVISKYISFNKSRRELEEPRLNSQHINVPGDLRTLYISEYLTSKSRRLFYVARLNVKDKKLVAAWTSYGKVYIKKEEGSSPVRINDESELNKLIL